MNAQSIFSHERPVVCIQGLGFVGMAMAIAVADAKDQNNNPYYNVIGVDLPNEVGLKKVTSINSGKLPIVSNDVELQAAFDRVIDSGNLVATTDPKTYSLADIIVVDIHLDVIEKEDGTHSASFDSFKNGLRVIGENAKPGTLVLLETTVPPGTCEKVVIPELRSAMKARGFDENSLLVAHSYERVMPGKDYFKSIVNFWRVYSGATEEAANAAEAFLSKVIDVDNFPLTRLHSTTASETAKVLENSYRAANIALIQEWGAFAEAAGVDLFQVLDAIRIRPTHSNIRQPGFGVGGYCLTKDPHFVDIGARELFGFTDLKFPFCKQAVAANQKMPITALDKIEKQLGGNLEGKTILLLGVSYRQDVGDTRYSPSEPFVVTAEKKGAKLIVQDPLVEHWEELDRPVLEELPSLEGIDAVVFAVPHKEYRDIDVVRWVAENNVQLLDANNVLTPEQVNDIATNNLNIKFIGKGIK
ncbi:nucleotide sugar dehydrogenase [Emcibacter nanhaiensis]|uniref:Nucleotide sugar dehydrogenase n=1 Tax=Emcibacter nanhaiensis TaxID=1505037 RepID=A0A501PBZ7_9PROT|nr:nucleotide sugar dehydrogenase [Emcibacter nanhaiensis]TPD57404.1 nucleotide sugar dehydrogenase [Emcibacter nanhaiensis]